MLGKRIQEVLHATLFLGDPAHEAEWWNQSLRTEIPRLGSVVNNESKWVRLSEQEIRQITLNPTEERIRQRIPTLSNTDLSTVKGILRHSNAVAFGLLSDEIERRMACDLRETKDHVRPHWTRFWGFLAAVVAAIAASIAAWPVIQGWLHKVR